jgi:hypothetical protein
MRAGVAIAVAVVLGVIGTACLFLGTWQAVVLIVEPEDEIGDLYLVMVTLVLVALGLACLAGARAAFRARA